MKEENDKEYLEDATLVSEILMKIFILKKYTYQRMFSIMAYFMLNTVMYLARQMKHDEIKEIEHFMAYLSDIKKQIIDIKNQKKEVS